MRSENLEKIRKRLFVLGGGHSETKATKAAEALLKRDFNPIFNLKSHLLFPSQSYFSCVPSSFITKTPTVLNTESMPESEISQWKITQTFAKGDSAEKACYEALKDYFASKDEWVLMLHGPNIIDFDLSSQNLNSKEKDFIVVNGTRGYILFLEAKHSLQGKKSSNRKSSMDQLKDAKIKIQNWFGADVTSAWVTIGMVYCHCRQNGNCVQDFCNDCQKYLVCGKENIKLKLDQVIARVPHIQPKPQEFRIIAKYLLFFATAGTICIGANQKKAITKNINAASSARNIDLWTCFWTPDQKSILEAEDLPRVAFTSSCSTGKTLLMTEKALRLAHKGDLVIFAIQCRSIFMSSDSLLKLDLEQKFSGLNIRVILTRQLNEILSIIRDDLNHHVFIDELVLDDYNGQKLKEICTKAKTVWLATADHFFEDQSTIFHELNFYLPVLKLPLRNTKSILYQALAQTTEDNGLGTNGVESIMANFFKGYKSKALDFDYSMANNLTEGTDVAHFEATNLSKGLENVFAKHPDTGKLVIYTASFDFETLTKVYSSMNRPYLYGSSDKRPNIKSVFRNFLQLAVTPPDLSSFAAVEEGKDVEIQNLPSRVWSDLAATMPLLGEALGEAWFQDLELRPRRNFDILKILKIAKMKDSGNLLSYRNFLNFTAKLELDNGFEATKRYETSQRDNLRSWVKHRNEMDLLISEMDDIQNGFEHHTVLIVYKSGVKPKVNYMMRAIAQLILLEIQN